jgi:transposase
MSMLVDRRDELGRARTQTVNRLHRLLLELFPGGAKKFLSATQARALVATTRPRDIVGKTRRRLAVELITELETIDKKIKTADKDLREPGPIRLLERYSKLARCTIVNYSN